MQLFFHWVITCFQSTCKCASTFKGYHEFSFLFFSLLFFLRQSLFGDQTGLNSEILLPLPPKCSLLWLWFFCSKEIRKLKINSYSKSLENNQSIKITIESAWISACRFYVWRLALFCSGRQHKQSLSLRCCPHPQLSLLCFICKSPREFVFCCCLVCLLVLFV